MGTVLSIPLAVLVGLVLVVLLVPVHLVARGTFTDDVVDGRAFLSWGLGLVSVDVSASGAELRIAGRHVHRFATAARQGPRPVRTKNRTRVDPRLVVRIVRRAIASLGVRARVAGRLGAGDPADTAQLFAWLTFVRMLPSRVDVEGIEIDWMEPALDLEGQVEGWLWPVAIASIAVGEIVRERRRSAARRGAA